MKPLVTNTQSKVEIKVCIITKGIGKIAEFTKAYTMQEHFVSKWREDGYHYAKEKLNLFRSECIVNYAPIISGIDKQALELKLGGTVFYFDIHNPMQSCFSDYHPLSVDGMRYLIKEVCDGFIVAPVNEEWVIELGSM